MTDHPDPDRSAPLPPNLGSRDGAAGSEVDERDSIADDRDSIADDRDSIADDRDSIADDRDLRADHGDNGSPVEQDGAAVGHQRARSVERKTASLDRDSAAEDRVDAAGRRHRVEEAAAVGAHVALNSSAVVVNGVSLLKDKWLRISAPERKSIVERVHVHALQVDAALRGFIRRR